jgi:rhodanese-related sulfurtransferase
MSFLQSLFSLLSGGSAADSLSPASFREALETSPRPLLVDVRTAAEFKNGHLRGARNLELSSPALARELGALAKQSPVLLYCQSGGRSAAALAQAKRLGLAARHLAGGIGAWKAAGYPVAR